jgi:hypothetical protein
MDYHNSKAGAKLQTPNTKAVMFTSQHLVNVGSQSIIQDWDKILHNIAQRYVTPGSKNIPEDDFITHHPKEPPPIYHQKFSCLVLPSHHYLLFQLPIMPSLLAQIKYLVLNFHPTVVDCVTGLLSDTRLK